MRFRHRLSALAAVGLGSGAAFLDRLGYWERFALALLAALAGLASIPGIRALLGRTLIRWRERSPEVVRELARRPHFVIFYSFWFGSLFALLELTYWVLGKYVIGNKAIGAEFLWKLPVGYLAVSGLIACCLYAMARWRSRAPVWLLVFVCTWFGLSGFLYLVPGLHRLAALLLAAGAATQAARFARRHAFALSQAVRHTRAAVVVVTTIAIGAFVWQARTERQAADDLPPARPGRPNILLVVLDTVGASRMSLYGHHRSTTPNLDRLAALGTVFTRAYATSPWTLPSHTSMFTGRYPHETSARWERPLDTAHPTIAEALRGRGYQTAGFVANLLYCAKSFGLGRGFVHYEDHVSSVAAAIMATSPVQKLSTHFRLTSRFRALHEPFRLDAAEITGQLLQWLAERDRSRPFFAFVNYFDAHAPYYPPEPFLRRFSTDVPIGDLASRDLDEWPAGEIAQLAAAHDGAIAYIDEQLGRLVDELKRREDVADTIVIVTADHGEQFGEHGLLEHANSLYSTLLHVPLFIVASAAPAGGRVDVPVSLRSLPATILDLVGDGKNLGFPGRSLVPLWNGNRSAAAAEDVILAEVERNASYPASYPVHKGAMRAIVYQNRMYIRNGDGREELYDIGTDPQELQNLASTRSDLLPEYRSRLSRVLASEPRPRHAPRGVSVGAAAQRR